MYSANTFDHDVRKTQIAVDKYRIPTLAAVQCNELWPVNSGSDLGASAKRESCELVV